MTSILQGQEQAELARWAQGLERSALQKMLFAASGSGILSFALGMPAVELFGAVIGFFIGVGQAIYFWFTYVPGR